jgi:hypothetical protein
VRHANKVLVMLTVAVILPLAYFGAYFALVSKRHELGMLWVQSPDYTVYVPHYRVGGSAAETMFLPAHKLDLMLRPSLWTVPELLDEQVFARPAKPD